MYIKAKEPVPEPPAELSEPSYEVEELNCSTEEQLCEGSPKRKKRFETSKLIVWVCLINGFLWVWCSYVLAWFGREQIAESLSQVALTEIIGVVLVHCAKTVVENLSKNNKWPDKPGEDEPPGGVG